MSKQSTPMKRFKEIVQEDLFVLEVAFNNKRKVRKIEKRVHYMTKECKSKTFKKWILEFTDCIPTKYLEYLCSEVGIKPSEIYESSKLGKAIFQSYRIQLENMRTLYLRTESGDFEPNFETRMEELTISELLKYDKNSIRRPFEISQLQNAFLPFLFKHPKVFTWDELLEKHLSIFHGPKSIKKQKLSTDNSEINIPKTVVVELSPWKTKTKIESFAARQGWSFNNLLQERSRHKKDVFVMKEQKRLMKHFCGPRYSFVIDYMFAGKFVYLIAINMNTRKAFAIPAQKIKETEQYWKVPDKLKETAKEAIDSMRKLIQAAGNVKHLLSDQEHIWKSKEWKDFLKQEGITHDFYLINNVKNVIETKENDRPNHSSTSLADRLIRTLRMMAYTLGKPNEIPPDLMEYLIQEYNSSPHSTLTKYLKKPTCPNEVDENVDLETKIVKAIMVENMFVEAQPDYQVRKFVQVYNEANAMDKVKPKLLPGKWEVVGFNKGLVQVKQGNNILNVNRWMLKNTV